MGWGWWDEVEGSLVGVRGRKAGECWLCERHGLVVFVVRCPLFAT